MGVFSGFLNSVSYRSNTGKERKKKSCQELRLSLRHFEQILPTFGHGTKVKPWKFEKKKNYQIYRSFDGRVKVVKKD